MQKRRIAKSCNLGQSNPRAKLTDREVELVRRMVAEGVPAKEVAVIMDISVGHCHRLVRCAQR